MTGHRRVLLCTGSLCPLCDEARDLVYSLLPQGIALEEINIDEDPQLREQYGHRIPVLALIDGGDVVAEKAWPFSPGQVKRLVAAAG